MSAIQSTVPPRGPQSTDPNAPASLPVELLSLPEHERRRVEKALDARRNVSALKFFSGVPDGSVSDLIKAVNMGQGRFLPPATAYTQIQQLEQLRLIQFVRSTSGAGRPANLYAITPLGRACLSYAQDQFR